MQQIRCERCNKLLCKAGGRGRIEAQCPRCGHDNVVEVKEDADE